MNRRDVFNLKSPTPFDVYLKPIFQRYQKLKDEVLDNWRKDVAQGGMGQRNYIDLDDLRLDITKQGTPVIRIVPFIGDETQEELNFYIHFFATYHNLRKALYQKFKNYWFSAELLPTERRDSRLAYTKQWQKENKKRVHQLIGTMRVLITLMMKGQLEDKDLRAFNAVADNQMTSLDKEAIEQLIHDAELGSSISIEFQEGNAEYWEYPESEFVQALWNHSNHLASTDELIP